MDMGFRFGQMEPSTEDIGKTTEPTARDVFGMQMETNLKVNSRMTSLTARVPIRVRTAQSIKECGFMMFNTARDKLCGQMGLVL